MPAQSQTERRTLPQRLAALWRRRWIKALAALAGLCAALFLAASVYIALHVQPLVKARLVQLLRERFNSPVELDSLHVSLLHGMEIRGSGLRIAHLSNPGQPDARTPQEQSRPMLSIEHFDIRGAFHQLADPVRPHIATVLLDGVELRIPQHTATSAQRAFARDHPLPALLIDHFRCRNFRLIIEPDRPGKGPSVSNIPELELTGVGPDRPFHFTATVLSPIPRATLHATGMLGPWFGAAPRETPLQGTYSFDDMNLSTIKGLGGTLASHATFTGSIGHLTVDGVSSSPDFSLDVSSHPMPLAARFHAEVDVPSGDTRLLPVAARLGQSEFAVTGSVLRVQPGVSLQQQGHDIALDVAMPQGRIEDLLTLGTRTAPPCMRGGVNMRARLHIPPGPERVSTKMQLAGSLHLEGVSFTSAAFQSRIDDLSTRAQGHPREAGSTETLPDVTSRMSVDFALAHALLLANRITYEAPGMNADLAGAYALDGAEFDFRGRARTRAAPSQMLTGWKSWLLKGLDPFMKKGDFGVVLPIELSGVKNDIHVGLAMHGVDDTAQQIAAQMAAQTATQMGAQRKAGAAAPREQGTSVP